MDKFNQDKIREIKFYPYLDKIDELDYPPGNEVQLRYGEFYEKTPFLNIIIPTYKRPQLLKETLCSILASDKFDDYQIVIMDNEGVEETPGVTLTEQMIKAFDSDKIVYFREATNTPFNWNHLIKYAKAEWLCMIHDDDLIDRRHLWIMSNIVKEHKEIDYLGCRLESFFPGEEPLLKKDIDEFHIEYYCCTDFMYGFQVPLLGAFFKRENAVNLGGIDTKILSGIGDYIFVAKQAFYFNVYCCDAPLYKYRIGRQQLTANTDGEYNCRISDYYLMREIARKTHPIMSYFYFRSAEKAWLDKIVNWCQSTTYGDRGVRPDDILQACGINGNIKKGLGKRNWFAVLYWGLRRRIYKYCHPAITMRIGSGNGYDY